MAPVTTELIERRGEQRCAGGGTRWQTRAVLRPGQLVTLLNISRRAALVESHGRLRPGALTEIQLASGNGVRVSVKGRLERSYVSALEPIRYRAVMVFEGQIDVE